MTTRKTIYAIIAVLAGISASTAFAGDTPTAGKITQIDATGGQNFAFRVYFTANTQACGSGSVNWVYMNTDYDNYAATAALLMSAYLTGRNVTIYAHPGPSGYCQLSYVTI